MDLDDALVAAPDAGLLYPSRAFANFASEKLSETKATVIDVLVKHLLEKGTDDSAHHCAAQRR